MIMSAQTQTVTASEACNRDTELCSANLELIDHTDGASYSVGLVTSESHGNLLMHTQNFSETISKSTNTYLKE